MFALTGIAACLALIGNFRVRLVASATVFAFAAVSAHGYFHSFQKEDWKAAVRLIGGHASSSDLIVVCGAAMYKGLLYYLRYPGAPVVALVDGELRRINWDTALVYEESRMRGVPAPHVFPRYEPIDQRAIESLWIVERVGGTCARPAARRAMWQGLQESLGRFGLVIGPSTMKEERYGIQITRLAVQRTPETVDQTQE